MGRLLEDCKRWVSLLIQESFKWRDSQYLPKLTFFHFAKWCVLGLMCQAMLAYFFYDSWVAMLLLFPITVVLIYRQWMGWKEQVLLTIEEGFKEWLYYVKGGLNAGKSIEHAIFECRNSFRDVVGEGHFVLIGLEQVYRGLELHIPLEECIRQFGEDTRIESIEDFAVVFEIAKKQGGQMATTLEKMIQQIYEKSDLRLEIHAMIATKKTEQRIMCIMPFAIMFFVGRSSGGYFTPLYHNIRGNLIMSVCLIVYLIGVYWGEKLTEVRI